MSEVLGSEILGRLEYFSSDIRHFQRSIACHTAVTTKTVADRPHLQRPDKLSSPDSSLEKCHQQTQSTDFIIRSNFRRGFPTSRSMKSSAAWIVCRTSRGTREASFLKNLVIKWLLGRKLTECVSHQQDCKDQWRLLDFSYSTKLSTGSRDCGKSYDSLWSARCEDVEPVDSSIDRSPPVAFSSGSPCSRFHCLSFARRSLKKNISSSHENPIESRIRPSVWPITHSSDSSPTRLPVLSLS